MKVRRLVATTLVAILVVSGLGTPRPARADTGETVIIAVAATAAYFLAVFAVVALWKRSNSSSLPFGPVPASDASEQRSGSVRFVGACPHDSGNLTLVCW